VPQDIPVHERAESQDVPQDIPVDERAESPDVPQDIPVDERAESPDVPCEISISSRPVTLFTPDLVDWQLTWKKLARKICIFLSAQAEEHIHVRELLNITNSPERLPVHSVYLYMNINSLSD
jgi:hypothetical protein